MKFENKDYNEAGQTYDSLAKTMTPLSLDPIPIF